MYTNHSYTTITLPARPGQSGDYCLLLEPSDPFEIALLRQRQEMLQLRLGGHIVDPVHLTCQRFELQDECYLDNLLDHLFEIRSFLQFCPLTAIATVPLYSQFRNLHLFKWAVQRTPMLERLCTHLESVLDIEGVTPLYPPGWVSLLVTALEGIEGPIIHHHSQPLLQPFYLFTPGFVSLSRLNSSNGSEFDYELITRFHIWPL